MLIISILLSGVNWIQTVTIVWSETSLFLEEGGDVCHGAGLATVQLFQKFVLFLFGNVIEKCVNKNNDCDDPDSSCLFRSRCFHIHYLKFLQPPCKVQRLIPTSQR